MQQSSRRKIRRLVAAGATALSLVGIGVIGQPAGASPTASAAPAVSGASASASASAAVRAEHPSAYAARAFRAWLRGDERTLDRLAAGAVADFLSARAPEGTTGWDVAACSAGAGSTYCSWSRDETTLTLRVANEPASQGQPDAVTSARFTPPFGGVAVWPFITAEEAANTQEQVDQGHSPWMVEPTAVAEFYAGAVLGWQEAGVEPVRPGVYWVTDPVSGARAEVELGQPARSGEGGIWAVVEARSVALG
jgi:hypothetical protein